MFCVHVCGTLPWLYLSPFRYDPGAEVPSDTDSPEDRVIFVKAVTQFMVSNGN